MKEADKLEIYRYEDTKYEEICSNCSKKHTLFTQHDNNPEYYTNVLVVCECGEYIPFNLPVN